MRDSMGKKLIEKMSNKLDRFYGIVNRIMRSSIEGHGLGHSINYVERRVTHPSGFLFLSPHDAGGCLSFALFLRRTGCDDVEPNPFLFLPTGRCFTYPDG